MHVFAWRAARVLLCMRTYNYHRARQIVCTKHDRSRGDSHPLCICCCVYTLSVAETNSILEHSALPPTDNKTGLQHGDCIRCNFQTKPRPIGPDKIVAGAIGGAGRDGRRVDGTKPWIIVAGSIGGAGISDQGQ